MTRDDPIVRNLKARQEAFLVAADSRGYSIAVLAKATGTPEDTLRSYKPLPSREASAMPLQVFIKLARIPGLSDLCSMLIEDSGHSLAAIEPKDTGWDVVAAEAAQLTAEICTARADGRIDHVEDAKLRSRSRKLIAEMQSAITHG